MELYLIDNAEESKNVLGYLFLRIPHPKAILDYLID